MVLLTIRSAHYYERADSLLSFVDAPNPNTNPT